MARGTAVEKAFELLLRKYDMNDALVEAYATFEQETIGVIDEKSEKEKKLLPSFLNALQGWKAPGDLNATQLPIELYLDGIDAPIVGYLDFAFGEGDKAIDVDLKTTSRMPSEPKPEHVRQVSIYRKARGRRGALLYATPKKCELYEVTDKMADDAMMQLRSTALSLIHYLQRVTDADDALAGLPTDTENFRIDTETAKAIEDYLEEKEM